MSAQAAATFHYVILAVGGLVWLIGLWFHRASFARPDLMRPEILREGEVAVAVDPAAVRDRLVQALRGGAGMGPGSFVIEEATESRIAGQAVIFSRKGGRGRMGLTIDLEPGREGTRATWRLLAAGTAGGLQWGGRLFVYGLTPAALAAAAWLVQTFVLPSQDPGAREAAIQTIQVVHFLWPPFLFGGLHRRIRSVAQAMVENTLRNAAF